MELIGINIKHRVFGVGQIIEQIDEYIVVNFSGQEKRFIYPDAFESFLKVDDSDIENLIKADILQKQKQVEKQLEKINTMVTKLNQAKEETSRSRKKLNARANIAFKCNYCDGDCSEKHIGYRAACSDSMIVHNIREENRVWCSSEESPCRQYFDGNIGREELDSLCENDGFVCYESQMLRVWKAMAGVVQTGANKGQPMKLHQVQTNSLCVLTTRKPQMKEADRFIFGVFLVDETYEGDNRDEGYVTTSSKYKIELMPHEAMHMKFWNYHDNGNQPEKAVWSSGLHRYFEDDVAVQILRDIVKIKQGTRDEKLAQEFLEYFCRGNGVKLDTVAEPNGALLRGEDTYVQNRIG